MKTTSKIDARKRAREAKVKADAARFEQDKKIEDTATEFYLASDKLEDLRTQIAAAEAAVSEQVVKLFDLGETAERVSDLTGLGAAEVRAIRRRASAAKKDAAANR
ncbi:MAG: hypothetical protein M3Q98_16550 [Actinomycetota bacterium]|nr:hypothetical protein [Actinomycetota bacterium]